MRCYRPVGVLALVLGLAAITGCGTTPGPTRTAGDCTTELDAFAPYTGANCNACLNVTVAAPGEPPRCSGAEQRDPIDPKNADADGDGVVDRRDACLDTPSGADVLSNGCASMTLSEVTFHVDSAELTAQARESLGSQADHLLGAPQLRVKIAGHTDARGAAAYNQALSLRRARSVREYFVGQGIAADRLEVEGHGESRPVADNDTAAGRERNRRVELSVVEDQ
jgi:OOP family OmpA-OmpF porin